MDIKNHDELQQSLLEKIESGEIKMHSRKYFFLRALLFILAFILILVLAVFLSSFIFYYLRYHGLLVSISFGQRGVVGFLSHFPWFLVIIALFLVIGLDVFLRVFSLGYRKPAMYTTIGFILLAIIIGWAVERSSLHYRLSDFAEENNIPLGGGFYRAYEGSNPDEFFVGKIDFVQDNHLELVFRDGKKILFEINEKSHLPPHRIFKLGDGVVILGEPPFVPPIIINRIDDYNDSFRINGAELRRDFKNINFNEIN